MYRILFSLMLVACGTSLAGAQPPAALQPGKKLETEMTKEMAGADPFGNRGYQYLVPAKLKAGQSIEITASVVGDGRKVKVYLIDSTKATLAQSELTNTTQTLKVEKVNATGVYGVVVWSDKIGAFEVTAQFEEPAALTLATAKAKVERLKKELAVAETELKALEAKKP